MSVCKYGTTDMVKFPECKLPRESVMSSWASTMSIAPTLTECACEFQYTSSNE